MYWLGSRSVSRSQDISGELDASCPVGPVNQYITNKRTEFGTRGCTAYGWPSSGGMLIKKVDAVELIFLGVDRFEASSRSPDLVEEDRFCNRLRMLGAKCWKYEEDHIDVLLDFRERTALESSKVIFGWPTAGGVWVLRYESGEMIPKDLGRLHMALNMDERCRIMEEYGGIYHADPNEVGELAGLL